MTQSTAAKLFLAGCRAHAVALGITLAGCLMLAHDYGCTNVKGPDITTHDRAIDTRSTATTRRSEASGEQTKAATRAADDRAIERHEATRTTGGEGWLATHRIAVTIDDDGLKASVVDTTSASTQPSTVTIRSENATASTRTDTTSERKATTQASEVASDSSQTQARQTDAEKKGPTYSGSNADVTVDGDQLTSKAIRSKLADRWLIVLVLAVVGTLYLILPPPKGSTVTAIGFYAAAAASLVLSDFWFLGICGAAIVLALLPHLRASKLYTRLVAQVEDWKSDMPAGTVEREALDSTLAIAGRGYEKYVDRVRVQAKHAGVAKPVPPVPEVKSS